MTKLLLIRHSIPAWGPNDPPSKWVLTEEGRERSKLLGEYLNQRRVGRIFASDEVKAIETAEIAARVAGISEVVTDHDLREHDRDNSPRPSNVDRDTLVVECIRNPDELVWGNESVATARDRFGSAVTRLMSTVDHECVALVAHGTVITTFVGQLLNVDPVPIWESMGIPWFIEIDWPSPIEISRQMSFE